MLHTLQNEQTAERSLQFSDIAKKIADLKWSGHVDLLNWTPTD